MKNDSVLILCAGEQRRWGNIVEPKQLLYAGTETILDRIVRQVRERGRSPSIVTHKSILMRDGVNTVIPTHRRWKVESILDIADHWGHNSTLILLGDVIYQGHVMDRIFRNEYHTMFFGNYAEIFAYYFSFNANARKMLTRTMEQCERFGDIGSLHSLFRAYVGDFSAVSIERHKDSAPIFTHVTGDNGWTRDIDSPEDYERFLEQVVRPRKLDDLPKEHS